MRYPEFCNKTNRGQIQMALPLTLSVQVKSLVIQFAKWVILWRNWFGRCTVLRCSYKPVNTLFCFLLSENLIKSEDLQNETIKLEAAEQKPFLVVIEKTHLQRAQGNQTDDHKLSSGYFHSRQFLSIHLSPHTNCILEKNLWHSVL